jgi:hypothetical protein
MYECTLFPVLNYLLAIINEQLKKLFSQVLVELLCKSSIIYSLS